MTFERIRKGLYHGDSCGVALICVSGLQRGLPWWIVYIGDKRMPAEFPRLCDAQRAVRRAYAVASAFVIGTEVAHG